MARDTNADTGFGARLRRERKAAGLTQEELAEAAGLSVRAVRDLERGVSRPHRRTIGLLADVLELTSAARDDFGRAALGPAGAAGTAPPGPGGEAAQPPPWQLPAAAADFTGRSAELTTLTGLMDGSLKQGEHPPGTVLITAIGGTAGVGKTALAVHWAYQVADRFPDGQLYVNLRGYDPGQPTLAADALAAFLRALGVPGRDIPADTAERAARYRSLLAGRRMLVLLDNASSAEQVRPLLPASPGCLTVVTSRDALAGLVARDGARRLDLDLLSPADAGALLTTLIGDRAAADPAATAALATACARLPLALRVAAELAAAHPDTPLATLVTELADRQRRLDLLEAGGDPYTAVRAVFSWSCQHLDPAAVRTFRLLSLHPGDDFEVWAAAALTGTTLTQTRHLLDTLARANLIHTSAAGRYAQHDLLRAYGRELAAEADGAGQIQAALTRLFDHYLHAAATAMDTLFPAETGRRPRIPGPATATPVLDGADAARAWLDTHRDTLILVATHAAGHGWPGHAVLLSATLFRYLDIGGHFDQAAVLHDRARHAAGSLGDAVAEAAAANRLGTTQWRRERYRSAAGYLNQAVARYGDTDDRRGEASALTNLAILETTRGRYPQAAGHLRRALRLSQEIGDRFGEGHALGNLGNIEMRQGRYRQAAERQEQALALYREIGDRAGEVTALTRLGTAEIHLGQYEQAAAHQQDALALYRDTGDRYGVAGALSNLATIDRHLGHHERAIERQRQALALYRDLGGGVGEAQALNGLGEALLAAGRPDEAMTQHARALDLAEHAGEKLLQARARRPRPRGPDPQGHRPCPPALDASPHPVHQPRCSRGDQGQDPSGSPPNQPVRAAQVAQPSQRSLGSAAWAEQPG
jgi:tetratricopeptide (TPR) repeat protein/transcriptional regulator with XRE-family HTH domain